MRVEGLGPEWRIQKSEDVAMLDGQAFVRVAPSNCSLSRLVAADQETPAAATLQASNGLASLISMRNQAQALALSSSANAGDSCSLFDAPGRPRRPVRIARHQQQVLRNSPASLTLQVPVGDSTIDVDVLRPIHSADNLFVAYNAEMLTAVLHYIRTNGFKGLVARDRSGLPKGVHKRKGSFVVKYTKPCGSAGYKSRKTLEDALAFLADSVDQADADDAPSACG